MTEYHYRGQPLSSMNLWELGLVEKSIKEAEVKREEASKHPKFNVDREVGGKKVKKIPLPPINVEFLKLKDAIEAEIRFRQGIENG